MSAAWGMHLVAKVVQDREPALQHVQRKGVTPEMMPGMPGIILHFVYEYAQRPTTMGKVPPRSLIDQSIPRVGWPVTLPETSDLDVICDIVLGEFKKAAMERIVIEALEQAHYDANAGLEHAVQELGALRTNAGGGGVRLVDLGQRTRGVVDRYHQRLMAGGGIVGAPYPWKYLNDAVQGMHEGDFIFIYGTPKSGKTWVALKMLAHLFEETDIRAMAYGQEMRMDDLCLRLASIWGRADYTRVKNYWDLDPAGQPPEIYAEYVRFQETLAWIEAQAQLPMFERRLTLVEGSVDIGNKDPFAFLSPFIEEVCPKVLFIDSAYLVAEEVNHTVVMRMAASARRLADKHKIIVIITSQENLQRAFEAANRGRSVGASTASFGQGFMNDTALGVQIVNHTYSNGEIRLSINIVGGRRTFKKGFVIQGNAGHTFHELVGVKPFDLSDVLKAEQARKARDNAKDAERAAASHPTVTASSHAVAAQQGTLDKLAAAPWATPPQPDPAPPTPIDPT
jgi:hypothetical protein